LRVATAFFGEHSQVFEEDDNLFCHLLRSCQHQSFLVQGFCPSIVSPFLRNDSQLCEQRNGLALIACLICQIQSFLGTATGLEIVSLRMCQCTQLFPQGDLILSTSGMQKSCSCLL